MSLILSGSDPLVEVKTYPNSIISGVQVNGKDIHIEIPMEDFLQATLYVLTNTDIEGEDDPRPDFVKTVMNLKIGEGFGTKGKRLL